MSNHVLCMDVPVGNIATERRAPSTTRIVVDILCINSTVTRGIESMRYRARAISPDIFGIYNARVAMGIHICSTIMRGDIDVG